MRMRVSCGVGVLVASTFLMTGGLVEAATITGVNQFTLPGFSSGSLSFSPAAAPNNDDTTTPSPNTVSSGVFLNAGGFGVLDFEFNVADSGGTTEYLVTLNAVNNSGVAWNDFHFLLGFGTGADFVPVTAVLGLDFDADTRTPAPASSVFPTLDHQATRLDWSGATVNYLGGGGGAPFSSNFVFAVDIPDGLAQYHPQGSSRFTLRSFPTAHQVPEPTTATILILGAASVALRRHRVRARPSR